MSVLLQTSLGEFTINLHIELVPVLAANFLKLCTLKKYNNTIFHSVEKNFIARAGIPWRSDAPHADPNASDPGQSLLSIIRENNFSAFKAVISGTRPDPNFTSECCDHSTGLLREYFHPRLRHNRRGVVAMANHTTNQIGSAFYISLRDTIDYLDDKRSIIGYVTEGMDLLDRLNDAFVEDRITNKPLKPIRIFHTIVVSDPFPNPYGMHQLPTVSPVVIEDEAIEEGGNTVDQEIATLEQIAKSEAKSRAIALEILGDLPDAEAAPPDNVLFVCKLNSITEAKDLELIFSRFGPIVSCDIIRDWKTGDSLQYGFVEFEERQACENALFKMDGCLIDDRRIHVGFCQSVAKQWYAYQKHGARQKPDLEQPTVARSRSEQTLQHHPQGFVFEEDLQRHSTPRSTDGDKRRPSDHKSVRRRTPIENGDRETVHSRPESPHGRVRPIERDRRFIQQDGKPRISSRIDAEYRGSEERKRVRSRPHGYENPTRFRSRSPRRRFSGERERRRP